jgi:uncharacterized Zn finger protein (UPF0148 family)
MADSGQSAESGGVSASGSSCPGCGAVDVRLKNVDGVLICDKCASKKFSSKVRASIQEAFEKQQENARREAYNKRLQITKQAYTALAKGKVLESVQLYEKYLDVLNTRFKTTTNNLHLGLFDSKKDQQEIMLATAVFWDLARTLDKIKERESDFRLYLTKYVQFSIGTKHMILSAETIRKYLKQKRAVHVKDFEQAHTALRSQMGKCFIAGAVYGEFDTRTELLRNYRDEHMLETVIGRAIVWIYYKLSPSVAAIICKSTKLQVLTKGILDGIVVPAARKKVDSSLKKISE